MIHQNLCDYAEDKAALYRLWDNDLRKMMRRRQFFESSGFLFLLASSIAWRAGVVEPHWLFFGGVVGVTLLFAAVKFMIDESNINYLMHQWDLQNALEYFRETEKRE
jgi:hypothetical protein